MTLILSLPFMFALAFALHAGLARVVKTIVAAARPLATGEAEAAGYERYVYHTAQPEMLQLLVMVAASGLLFWLAFLLGASWPTVLGVLLLAGAVALDLLRWQRVAVSAHYLWAQDGLRGEVRQVAFDNVGELSVQEKDTGGFTLRRGTANRLCRLQLRLNDGEPVKLPWTDAYRGLDAVEAIANHIRTRQMIDADGRALRQAQHEASEGVRRAAQATPGQDAELRAELKRLRQRALAPDVPPAATRKSNS